VGRIQPSKGRHGGHAEGAEVEPVEQLPVLAVGPCREQLPLVPQEVERDERDRLPASSSSDRRADAVEVLEPHGAGHQLPVEHDLEAPSTEGRRLRGRLR